ncbi:holo-ACP synthase [Cytobacillus sp. IB215316]|uniref:holo-ACP synthase n=1 Tax=Cytobacillus sp. IB215316 TaxID=3097354 RepID=UPI002A17DA80|nr:holo-ACP synthase [Cytobacillus sp. IB215316]MDX8362831.1 holo-ACP synthase [Cytobacillus sp. IB215316]
MIIGIGIDIVEIKRVASTLERQGERFINRILTQNEQKNFNQLQGLRQIEFFCGRFAAKEAYSKALGTGIGKEISFLDIEITSNEQGRPIIAVSDENHIHLSISHSQEYAVAQVIIESSSS